MLFSIKGKVKYKNKLSIVIEANNIGYEVFYTRLANTNVGEEIEILTDEIIKEDDHFLVGFLNEEEKNLYNKLKKIKGVGPKTAVLTISKINIEEFNAAILCSNVIYLTNVAGLSERLSNQLLLEFNSKDSKRMERAKYYEEALKALMNWGYKKIVVERALAQINDLNLSIEDLIKKALERLKK